MEKAKKFLFFLLVLLLPSQLAIHYWPDNIAWLPVRSDYLALTIYLTDLLAGVLLVISLPSVISDLGHMNSWKKPFVWVILAAAFNIVLSLHPFLSFWNWFRTLLFLVVLNQCVRPKGCASLIFTGLNLSLIWVSLLGIAQVVNSGSLGGLFWWLGERPLALSVPTIASVDLFPLGLLLRAYSTFPHPNALAGYLLVTSLFVYQLNKEQPNQSTLLVWSARTLSAACLILTFSYSAIVFGLLGIYYLYLSKTKTAAANLLKHAAIIILIAVAVVAYAALRPESFAVRIEMVKTATTDFVRFPLFGVGAGMFVLGTQQPIIRPAVFYQPVHNLYLLLLVELGIIPLIAIFNLLRSLSVKSIVNSNYFPPLAVIILLGSVDHYWLTSHSNLVLMLLLLTALISGSLYGPKPN